ncbi:MAG TPA: hypothetical protein VFG87_13195 [Amycolatopsis sp.]|jgi:hypothetical protein|nr:hypothetical protein [Amycolatopsis sp.]
MRSKKMSVLGLLSILCAAVALAIAGAAPASAGGGMPRSDVATAATVATSPAAVVPQSTYKDCPSTYFCAYDSYGDMCKWQDDSSDWYTECSWAGIYYPKYVFNNGTSGLGVTIYRYTGYSSAIGSCIKKGAQVTLAGNYDIGSHQWNC